METPPLNAFLCDHFGVQHLYDIAWYAPDTPRTSEQGRVITLQLKVPTRVDQPGTPLSQLPLQRLVAQRVRNAQCEYNLDRVCVQSIMIRGYHNDNPYHVGVRCNTLPKDIAKTIEEYDRVKAASFPRPEMAGIRMDLQPSTSVEHLEDNLVTYLIPQRPDIMCMNTPWTQCTGLLTPDNIMNGVVHIPRDVCIAQTEWARNQEGDPAKAEKRTLPVWVAQPDGPQEPCEESIHHWVAVPSDHILATYCYGPHQMLAQRNIVAKMIKYRRGNAPPRAFFVMTHSTMRQMCTSLCDVWLKRRDLRPLGDVRLQTVTMFMKDHARETHQDVYLNVSVSFVAWPQCGPEDAARMMPTCNADLVSLVYTDTFQEPPMRRMLNTLLPRQ